MSLANHLHRQPSGRYHARLRVPKDLVEIVGKKELWQTCATTDPEKAKDEKAAIVKAWRQWFGELRRRHKPSEDQLQRAVFGFYQREVEIDVAQRQTYATQAEIDGAERKLIDNGNPFTSFPAGTFQKMLDKLRAHDGQSLFEAVGDLAEVEVLREAPHAARRRRELQEADLRDHLMRGETALIEWAADGIIRREAFDIDKGSADYRALCQRLQRALFQGLQRAKEHDRGEFGGISTDPTVKPPVGAADGAAPPGQSILELFNLFALENPDGVKDDTLQQNRKVVALFAEMVGARAPIKAMRRETMREFKARLHRWPIKAAEIKDFKGLKFNEVIEKNRELGKPAISRKTLNRYLSALGSFSNWLRAHDYIAENPVEGMFLSIDKDDQKVRSFTIDELNAIFASPVFTGARSSEEAHLPGKVDVRDWRRWLPLCALFSGCRLGELAQLHLDDVRQLQGSWVFHITREGAREKTLKTKASQRLLPIHSMLVKLGFLEYYKAVKASGKKRLFPQIELDARGHVSGYPSRWWGRYLKRIGVKTDREINFHSFRHTVIDALRRAGYLDHEFKFLVGHGQGDVTGRYGVLQEGPLKLRVEMVEKIEYPGLDLEGLSRP